MQELIFRIIDYFFDQFLDSLTNTNPYLETSTANDEQNRIAFSSLREVEDFDLQQDSSVTALNVEVASPTLIFKARPHFDEYFACDLGEIIVTSKQLRRKGKWRKLFSKQTLTTVYMVQARNLSLSFNGTHDLLRLERLSVSFERLCFSPLLERIDPLVLDQAFLVDLEFSPCLVSFT